jgi:RNA polymerase sigma-70 factor (ECF subfamily)
MDERVVLSVRIFAKNLKRTNILRSMEIEDIEQELMCEVLSCLNKFDEKRGDLEHFIRKVLARRSINLLQNFSRTKRGVFLNIKEYSENDNFEKKPMDENLIDLTQLMDYLPSQYKALCKLLANHSIAETSRIVGKTRASLYRDLKRISLLAAGRHDSEDQILAVFFSSGVNMKNLSVLETSDAKEISELDVHDLMDLSDQVAKLISHAKELKEKLDDALHLRFSETVKNNLRNENKDTGTTRFFDGAFQIVAEVPKKVTWDNEKMEEIVKQTSVTLDSFILGVNNHENNFCIVFDLVQITIGNIRRKNRQARYAICVWTFGFRDEFVAKSISAYSR